MKRAILLISTICLLFASGCSQNGGGQESVAEPTSTDTVPTGTWVIRYYGDENGQWIEDLNTTETNYLGNYSYIEYNILQYGRTERFVLDENGKGTFTDSWDESQEVTFEDDKVIFEDGYETHYTIDGDKLWYQAEYREYYNVMENVSEELLTEILNGAYDCVDLNKAETGDLVAMGTFDTYPYNEKTESLKWRVIDKKDDKILILCEQLIDVFAYNTNPDMKDLDKVTWENSSLRSFLNDPDGFLLMFDDDEIERIQTTHLENKAANTELMKYWGDFEDDPDIPEKPNWSTMAVQDLPDDPDTDDRIFLLSFQEVEKYFGEATMKDETKSYPYNILLANSKWIAYVSQVIEYNVTVGFSMYNSETYGGAWMTRTLCTDHHDEKMVTYINASGQPFAYFTYAPMFIRPAMWIRTD